MAFRSRQKSLLLRDLLLLAVVLGFTGLLWDLFFPINKKLWTSSYVLYAGGIYMILLAGSLAGHELSWVSYVILPIGATCWAIYTHAFKHSGLSAFEGGALICVWSTIINLAMLPFFGTGLFDVPMGEIGLQLLTQGVLSGLVSTILYGWAVRSLGGTQAAAYTAITPVAAAFAGGWLLGEPLGIPVITAAFVTGAGVLLSTGILSRRRR